MTNTQLRMAANKTIGYAVQLSGFAPARRDDPPTLAWVLAQHGRDPLDLVIDLVAVGALDAARLTAQREGQPPAAVLAAAAHKIVPCGAALGEARNVARRIAAARPWLTPPEVGDDQALRRGHLAALIAAAVGSDMQPGRRRADRRAAALTAAGHPHL